VARSPDSPGAKGRSLGSFWFWVVVRRGPIVPINVERVLFYLIERRAVHVGRSRSDCLSDRTMLGRIEGIAPASWILSNRWTPRCPLLPRLLRIEEGSNVFFEPQR